MRRIIATVLAALALIAGLGVVAAAASHGNPITRARLERALPVTFSQVYAREAKLLGHQGITPASLHATAMCDKHGPDVPDVGAGSDWVCLMGWKDPNVPMPPEGYGKFEVTVHSNGCFTSGAPSKYVGYQTITDASGREVTNPAYEFDGCFDPAGDNAPTGVSYPSVLGVASTVLQPDASGHVKLQVTCGTGAQGCSGTVQAVSGKTVLGTESYTLREEQTASLAFPKPLPAGAADATFTFTAKPGSIAPSPTTVTVQK